MIFNKIPLKNESYYVSLDDHCLAIKSGLPSSDKLLWLSRQMCQWIKANFDYIDFDKQKFDRSMEFDGSHYILNGELQPDY